MSEYKNMDLKPAINCIKVGKIFSVQREKSIRHILFGSKNLRKEPFVEALRDISLTVQHGKIVGVLGSNGAGKSTLLRLLGHVYTPTTGHIEINGQVAGLFELGGMGNPNLTGRQYAIRYLTFMGVRDRDLNPIINEIYDFSELGEYFDMRIRTYSSGMAARLYFAVATASQHEIYLIDELLSVGDEHFKTKCWRKMRERLLNGASGVLVTHDWTAIVKLCEYAFVIENGSIKFKGTSDKAVVSYLNLPIPKSSTARFGADLSEEFVLKSGEISEIRIPIEILDNVEVECAISIELLRIGIGWEAIILTDFFPVANKIGEYVITFEIPYFPIIPGNYSLNLFLSRRPDVTGSQRIGLDVRSWTYGNGLRLKVEGDSIHAEVKLPFVVRQINSKY